MSTVSITIGQNLRNMPFLNLLHGINPFFLTCFFFARNNVFLSRHGNGQISQTQQFRFNLFTGIGKYDRSFHGIFKFPSVSRPVMGLNRFLTILGKGNLFYSMSPGMPEQKVLARRSTSSPRSRKGGTAMGKTFNR